MVDENFDLETALAPDEEIYEITEGLDDPLIDPTEEPVEDFSASTEELQDELQDEEFLEIEEPFSTSESDIEESDVEEVFDIEEAPLSNQIDLSTATSSDFESLEDAAVDYTGDYLEPPAENLEELLESDPLLSELDSEEDSEVEIVDANLEEIDYSDPTSLVATIIDKARAFTKYSTTSKNSVRRAIAVCNRLEQMIIDGVTKDAKAQRLSLAELKLLDDIEAGILVTKAELSKPRKVEAKSRSVDNSILYDPFCATVARILVNAQVQGGKKVQEIFSSLKDRYSIDQRESLMISQIMNDLGYPTRSLIDGQDMLEQYYA